MIAAIVPAAGESRRMGRPKLALPIDGVTVIARVVAALRDGGACPVVVVAPPADAPGALAIREGAERAGADRVIVPDRQPADMRTSVEIGLMYLKTCGQTIRTVIIAPGDSPGLSAALVETVRSEAERRPDAIVLPSVAGKRGHPVALPCALALAVFDLPGDVGVNALVKRHPDVVVEIDVTDPGAVADLDTPEDYQRWGGRDLGPL